MRDFVSTSTGITASVGFVAFMIFVLPTPHWLGWPCLAIAVVALGRIIIVGERRHKELRSVLDLDQDETERTETHTEEFVRFLNSEKRPRD